MYDVVIIGAGVIGCSIARELGKYDLRVCVVERATDVADGTSKANSAIVHAGFDAKPNSMKGKLNAKGNSMFDKLAKELDFPFRRIGSFVLCFEEKEIYKLEMLKEQGENNNVQGLKIIMGDEARTLEPSLSEKVKAVLYAPTGGIVCPYEMTIALAENAWENGVEFMFNTSVENIHRLNEKYIVCTNLGEIEAKLVVNAAGLFADEINNMVSNNKINIIPRKGEYCLFDKVAGNLVSRTIFQLPSELGKGVLITPTVDGNLLVGPNAEDIDDKEDLTTSTRGIGEIVKKASTSVKELPMNMVITSFSGLRAHSTADDFIIGEAEDAECFVNAAGIESPGLSSAPAIAEMVENVVIEKLNCSLKKDFNPVRKGMLKFRDMENEERKKLIEKNPSYGKIICRCETVTEGEILDSIRRPLGAKTLDGVKRRTRAGMGRCQSGFCSTKIVELLAKELQIPVTEVTKFGGNSKLLMGKNKEEVQ